MDAVIKIGKEADRLGYGYFWVPEAWGLEAFSASSHVLNVTNRIRVGPGVVNVFSRSASLIGMSCATVDQISPGRFILGLGASGKGLVEDWHGVKFEKPLARIRDYVAIIRKVACGETVDYSGETVKLSRFRLFTKAISSANRLEIYIGSLGEKSLSLAGEIADGAILTLYPKSKLRHAVDLAAGWPHTGKKIFAFYPLRVSASNSEKERNEKELAMYISFYVSSMGKYYAQNLSRFGYSKEVEEIKNAHSQGNREKSAEAVSEQMLEDLCYLGSPTEIISEIESLPERVVPVFALNVSTNEGIEAAITGIRGMARP